MRVPVLVVSLTALMCGAAMAQSVGVASAVNQSALGVAPGQVPKSLFLGDKIIHNQKITTDGKGLLQILLADGTSFTVGPNSSLTIDSFVYDPEKGTAKIVADIGTGVFRFIGGKSSKSPDGVTLNTPVGTVGIRGGISNLDFSGAVPYHIDMVYGQGVTLTDGTKVVGDIYHSGYSIVIDPNGKVGVEKTPPEWSQLFQTAMAGHGSGGAVTGNKVNGSLNNTNKPGGSNPPDQNETQVASYDPNSPVPTWGQIENSTLGAVTATYDGTYSGTLTDEGDFDNEGTTDGEGHIDNLAFKLAYSFGAQRGTAYFAENDADPLLQVPITPNSSTGPATFGFHATLDHPVPNLDGQNGLGASVGYGDLQGFFFNNPGLASGTAGTFDLHVVGGEDGSYHVVGAFGGGLTGAVPDVED